MNRSHVIEFALRHQFTHLCETTFTHVCVNVMCVVLHTHVTNTCRAFRVRMCHSRWADICASTSLSTQSPEWVIEHTLILFRTISIRSISSVACVDAHKHPHIHVWIHPFIPFQIDPKPTPFKSTPKKCAIFQALSMLRKFDGVVDRIVPTPGGIPRASKQMGSDAMSESEQQKAPGV